MFCVALCMAAVRGPTGPYARTLLAPRQAVHYSLCPLCKTDSRNRTESTTCLGLTVRRTADGGCVNHHWLASPPPPPLLNGWLMGWMSVTCSASIRVLGHQTGGPAETKTRLRVCLLACLLLASCFLLHAACFLLLAAEKKKRKKKTLKRLDEDA